ncbi:MAG: sigma-54-dependent Fis family transcriptional regulator [Bacteroides sp.]|nr:MAG: sigma-54-dependent Fis family transcriptional regulator [Bacteroides sp.]
MKKDNIQFIKNRFSIIGNNEILNNLIDIAIKIAYTDVSVLISGESGTGKEVFAKIIHQLSNRKHNSFMAINCGAIPEGTIDSELFGHVKGSFTSATEDRKGYFETVNNGTIFLDEIGEMPLSTQARLLRILELGEYMRVGSSKIDKLDIRIIAATNINIDSALKNGKMRNDLYYRLSTIKINIPSLRERKEDIKIIFYYYLKYFSDKYKTQYPSVDEKALNLIENYHWPGNIRQLKNIAEQIIVLENKEFLDLITLKKYIPTNIETFNNKLSIKNNYNNSITEKEFLYKILIDMKKEVNDLKRIVSTIIKSSNLSDKSHLLKNILLKKNNEKKLKIPIEDKNHILINDDYNHVEDTLSLKDQENQLIKKILKKNHGKRKNTASDLGISERTLYRKIKNLKIH